ncbi:MAG: alpha-(1-_3)-arabinofuranosyltransferase family protein, partial [Actinomycetota bacterium]
MKAAPRRALGFIALAVAAYVPPLLSAPGRVAADTKQYLTLDPGRLLGRAVSMWDPHIGMGTVTPQTIGYLFPMGPFAWVGERLGLPDWVVQRLWLGSLLFVAATGMLCLLRGFGRHGPGVVVAAVAYMWTPYVHDYAARISVLLLPWAALPWMIAVVRDGLRERSEGRLGRWRAPALMALIVQAVGGVNATALLLAGLGPVLWVLHATFVVREASVRRACGLVVRTGALTLAASAWWIAGLRMQAGYGLDILRYTETVDTVARTSSPNEVLRGLGYWFFYGQDRLGPWIESASDSTQHLWVIAAGYLLAAVAVGALAFVRWRHRTFLVALVVVGVVIAVGTHPYATPTPLGALFKSLAAGSTAALAMRSTGRVVPLVVCASAIAVGLMVEVVHGRLLTAGRRRLAFAVPVLVLALVAVNVPAAISRNFYGRNLQRPERIPAYWTEAIGALDARDHGTRILEVPGADFASYAWGNTVDPITPGLTDRPYLARELIPYGTAGTADLLNAIDRRMQEGVAEPEALAALWRRMGIGDVVARNDVQWQRYDLVPPAPLASLLARVPGLGPPVAYGPPAPFTVAGYEDEISLGAATAPRPVAPVVVYPVTDPRPIVRTEPAAGGLVVSGDGEGLVDVAAAGLLDAGGVVRYSASIPAARDLRAAVAPGAVLVVTDGNRLRARRWTSVRDNLGYTEQAGARDAPLLVDNGDARLPVFPGAAASASTTNRFVGADRVVASAYGNTITYTPEYRAARAFDGDLRTAWRANAYGDARGQRIRIDLDRPITTDRVGLVQQLTGARNRLVAAPALRFDGGPPVSVRLDADSQRPAGQVVTFGRRTFRSFELEVTATTDDRPNLFGQSDAVGFAEIRLRDARSGRPVRVGEIVVMPTDLTSALGAASADHPLVILVRREAIRPVPPRAQPETRMARTFAVPTGRDFALTGRATLSTDAPPSVLRRAVAPDGPTVDASGSLPGCLACGPWSAVDGDPATAWQTPFGTVVGQWWQVRNPEPIRVGSLRLRIVADGRHSVPTRLRVTIGGEQRLVTVPAVIDGSTVGTTREVDVSFAPATGRTVRVAIDAVREVRATRFATSATVVAPVAFAAVDLPGVRPVVLRATVDSGCRDDLLRIDGRSVPVRLRGPLTAADAPSGLSVTPCAPAGGADPAAVRLGPGEHTLVTAAGDDVGWSIDRLALVSGTSTTPLSAVDGRVRGGVVSGSAPEVEVVEDGATEVRARVRGATAPFWLVLGQSQSAGWRARVVGGPDLGGSVLVDGFANGWRVDPRSASDFEVVMEWVPQRQVHLALGISAVAILAALALAFASRRRAAVPVGVDGGVGFVLTAPVVRGRRRWIAPIAAGAVAAVAVTPWAGVLVGALIALVAVRPRELATPRSATVRARAR